VWCQTEALYKDEKEEMPPGVVRSGVVRRAIAVTSVFSLGEDAKRR